MNSAIYAIYLGNKITTIGEYMIWSSSLEVLIMSDKLQKIQGNALSDAAALKVLCLSDSVNTVNSYTVTSGYSHLYTKCSASCNVYPSVIDSRQEVCLVPNHITSVAARWHSNNHALREIIFKSDRNNTFSFMTEYALYQCGQLKSLVLPEGTTSFNSTINCVYGTCIEYISIPSTITTLDLKYLVNLKDMTINKVINFAFKIGSAALSNKTLIHLVNQLENRIDKNSLNLKLNKGLQNKLYNLYNPMDGLTLIESIQNKNWTVSFDMPSNASF